MKKILIMCFLALFFGAFSAADAKGANAAAAKNSTPAMNQAVNFETKKNEIIEVLGLSKKQQKKAEKIYNEGYSKIGELNIQIEDLQKEARMVKLSKIDTKTQLKRLSRIEDKLNPLYQKRDRVHNESQRSFEKVLDKKQKATWDGIKKMGARLYPECDNIRPVAEDIKIKEEAKNEEAATADEISGEISGKKPETDEISTKEPEADEMNPEEQRAEKKNVKKEKVKKEKVKKEKKGKKEEPKKEEEQG